MCILDYVRTKNECPLYVDSSTEFVSIRISHINTNRPKRTARGSECILVNISPISSYIWWDPCIMFQKKGMGLAKG